jgi:cytochrome c peroxidase
MPGDLQRTRRLELRLLEIAGVVLLVPGLTLGCSRAGRDEHGDAGDGPGAAARDSAIDGATASTAESDAGIEDNGPTALVRGFSRDGQRAADTLLAGCDDRGAYLAIRRDATALLSVWRRRLPIAGEVAFGPEIALQEAGGAIGGLDRAVEAHDCGATDEAAKKLEAAFHVTQIALTAQQVPPGTLGQAMSDAAYGLGQAVLESTPYVPEGDDAALADALGFLALLDGGAQVLGLAVAPELAAFDRLRAARVLAEVTDRAAIVRASGVLGSAIRRVLRARGFATNLTYRPLRDAPDLDALILPRPALPVDAAQAALGARLFHDARLSAHGARSCAGCHDPAHDYADGRVAPISLDPSTPLRRNTPTLTYAPLAALLTWDGRVRTADRQALMVIHTGAEMGSTDVELARAVAADPGYGVAFAQAFPGAVGSSGSTGAALDGGAAADGGPSTGSVTPANIGMALAEFEASALVAGSAPIDGFARGDDAALSRDARAGLDVFAGKGRCARCHVPPVFGGSRPPDFTAPVFAILGVPSAPYARSLDPDPGRGQGSFRVPSLRNAARTAPYFHHGRYGTLEQVVDFYDRGGGRGLGIAVAQQDPEVRPLHLSRREKRVLLVFLRQALSDDR